MGWTGDWPSNWPCVRVPERKKKLLDQSEREGKPLTFLYLNKTYTKAWKLEGDIVKNSPLEEVPNRFVPQGEYFFIIPITKATMVTL